MKLIMKTLLAITILAASMLTSQAASVVGANMGATHTRAVIATPVVLQNITLWSTNINPSTVRLYDGNIVWTNSAYTNIVTFATNLVQTYTNSVGTTNSFTIPTIYTSFETIAASTNNASTPIVAFVVPPGKLDASGVGIPGDVITYSVPVSIGQYLSISNNAAGVSYLINYRNP